VIPDSPEGFGSDNRSRAARARRCGNHPSTGLAGLEPATSRGEVDNPHPSARRTRRTSCGEGSALPAELQSHPPSCFTAPRVRWKPGGTRTRGPRIIDDPPTSARAVADKGSGRKPPPLYRTELRASTSRTGGRAVGGARTHSPGSTARCSGRLSYGRHTPAFSCVRPGAGGSVPPSALVVAFAPEPGAWRPAGPRPVNPGSSPLTSCRGGVAGEKESPRPHGSARAGRWCRSRGTLVMCACTSAATPRSSRAASFPRSPARCRRCAADPTPVGARLPRGDGCTSPGARSAVCRGAGRAICCGRMRAASSIQVQRASFRYRNEKSRHRCLAVHSCCGAAVLPR
jgi:hypothetical protein